MVLFLNYLCDRRDVNGPGSRRVPQGSIIGPSLFKIYINELEYVIKSEINFSADHTSLLYIGHNKNLCDPDKKSSRCSSCLSFLHSSQSK